MSRLFRLYSHRFRERYGDDAAEMLARSNRPFLDRIDIAVHAVLERADYLMKTLTTVLYAGAAILAVVSLVALGYSIPELAGGVRDIPRHWWSTLPLLGLLGAIGVVIFVRAHHAERE